MATNIINQKVNDFLETYDFKKDKRGEAYDFEKFCNYIAIYENIGKFEKQFIEITNVGKTQDIDGIVFVLDNKIIESIDDLEETLKADPYKINIDIIFTQSKTGSLENNTFDSLKRFVNDFLDAEDELSKYQIDRNSNFDNILKIRSKIFEIQTKVHLHIETKVYVFTKKTIDTNQISPSRQSLQKSNIELILLGDKEIFQKAKDFKGDFKIPPVKIEKVCEFESCLIGIISFKELKKIICDENNELRKIIFDDNIREYQGDTDVNNSISETLNKKEFNKFPLLNNGLTIVANNYTPQKNSLYEIKKPKIVNGCQTTYTLFKNKNIKGIDELKIPFKLIINMDNEAVNEITIASNSQNAIDEYLKISLKKFNKELEDFYNSTPAPIQFYYDRLKGKYKAKKNVISLKEQSKCFIATFLISPHKAVGWGQKSIIDFSNQNKIFRDGHSFYQYYLSYYMFYTFLEKGVSHYPNRYHIIYAVFKILTLYPKKFNFNFAKFESNIETNCKEIINWIADKKNKKRLAEILKYANEMVRDTLYNKSRYTQSHNSTILNKLKQKYKD